MSKIKICHITSAHDSNDTRIFQKECSYLAKNPEFDVYLIAKGLSRTENNVTVLGVGMPDGGRIKRILSFTKKIYKEALKLDATIYHIHDPELLPYAKKLANKGKIVIFDSHENVSEQILIKDYIPKILRKLIAKVYYVYESYVTRSIDCVIFPCPIEGRHPFQNRSKKAIYISNVPIISTSKIVEKANIAICYVGNLSENRGVTNLLKAYDIIENKPRFILAGKFESDEYKQKLESLGLLRNVDYRGLCSAKEVREIYMEASVGISNLLNIGQYPKLFTFPTKVFEYMEYGLAVIVSDYPFARDEIIKNKFGVLIDPSDIYSIANAIETIVNDRKAINFMGHNGRTLIDNKYNWDNEFQTLSNTYSELISKSQRIEL